MTERRPLPYEPADVRARLQGRVPELLKALGIREKAVGGRVFPLNPNRDDRNPGSFVISASQIAGFPPGSFRDFACGDAGDVFDLIQYLARPRPAEWIDAYWWALEFLHLDRGRVRTLAEDTAERERIDRERKAAEARAIAEDNEKSASLFKLWLSLPELRGTPAWDYMTDARRVPLHLLRDPPGALRWAERVEWIDPHDGEVHEWRNAMVSAMTRGKRVTALHITFLKPDGSGKADRDRAKLMYGSAGGACIRLSKGASGLSPSSAEAVGRTDPLILGEGIETTGTGAAAQPDYRAWACGSLDNMRGFDWPKCASALILLKERADNPTAAAAWARVEAHWKAQAKGRPVKIVETAHGSDLNDWIRAA